MWQKNITANFEISIGIGTRIPKGTTVQNLKRTCNILGNTYITDNENNEINLASKDVYEYWINKMYSVFFIKTGGRIYLLQLTANNHADHIFLKINAKQASDLHLFSQNYFAQAEFTCPLNVLLKNFSCFSLEFNENWWKCSYIYIKHIFSSNQLVHKISFSLCFWAPDPLMSKFD